MRRVADLVTIPDPASLDQVSTVYRPLSLINVYFGKKSIVKKSFRTCICLRKIGYCSGNAELGFGKQVWDQTGFASQLVSTFIEHLHDYAENKCPV